MDEDPENYLAPKTGNFKTRKNIGVRYRVIYHTWLTRF